MVKFEVSDVHAVDLPDDDWDLGDGACVVLQLLIPLLVVRGRRRPLLLDSGELFKLRAALLAKVVGPLQHFLHVVLR